MTGRAAAAGWMLHVNRLVSGSKARARGLVVLTLVSRERRVRYRRRVEGIGGGRVVAAAVVAAGGGGGGRKEQRKKPAAYRRQPI